MGFLTAWWARAVAPYVAAALGGLALFGSVLLAGRRQGRHAAERRALARDLDIRETRDAVDRGVAREPDAAGRLRERWSRD
jgi:cobalamin biosynthesis protein CobD/CbiB